ncbi:hypothetical protein SEA_BLINN1_46 [Mycobacterium phage Blinn1]|uniref:Uncharacterized protein n=1 Tax=Mycobacterium phage Blinn1 TaxID=2656562 RepID=A0A649VQP4_9CAUD|nr:hypothetical protein KIP53_gp063 [Mycobacterium phage Blinn1]QGJ94807.1 hypothetical protein SEA_BLINN1_46 [Mycobacterium phage Blinn1]
MKFGEKFSTTVFFAKEFLNSIGMHNAKILAGEEFYRAAERSPEVIVPFHHTLKQSHAYNHIRPLVAIKTEAIALRAQLAIEGPR